MTIVGGIQSPTSAAMKHCPRMNVSGNATKLPIQSDGKVTAASKSNLSSQNFMSTRLGVYILRSPAIAEFPRKLKEQEKATEPVDIKF